LSPEYIFIGGSYNEPFITAVDRSSLQESTTQKKHSGSVFSLYYHDDELVSGSANDTVSIWNPFDLSKKKSFVAGQHIVHAVACDNDYIFVGGINDLVGVYRRSNLEKIADLTGHNADIFSLATDDEFIYSGSGEVWWGGPGSPRPSSFESAIRVWSKGTWSCITVLEGHSDNVNAIMVDEHAVYSVSDDGTLRVYRKADWTSVGVLDLEAGALKALASDNDDLYVGGISGELHRVPKESFRKGLVR
jgi:WD40 repeat protein